ncbi:MAG: hypothetical protein COA73_18805 [Candidatus Hydrogenedentota bacterium]|nr:MAG: hypothetical protein COA73_18805 [Candidatus Hydrogenedentota bacterium]
MLNIFSGINFLNSQNLRLKKSVYIGEILYVTPHGDMRSEFIVAVVFFLVLFLLEDRVEMWISLLGILVRHLCCMAVWHNRTGGGGLVKSGTL